MNLEELIKALIEAKDHYVEGRSTVLLTNKTFTDTTLISEVKFDSTNCYLIYE